MALTKEQIIARLARRLVDDKISGLTWAQLVAAVQALDTSGKAALVAAGQVGEERKMGELLMNAVRAWALTAATTDATAMLATDCLALADIEKVLRA